MDFLALAAIATCFALAVNVGGNNSAAEMGPAFGAGVRSRGESVALISTFCLLGALLAGGPVVDTIATGIMGGPALQGNLPAAIVILLASALVVALANVLRVPLATSHAMVGAVVGVGLYLGNVNWPAIGGILAWWVATPLVALAVSFWLGRYAYARIETWQQRVSILRNDGPLFRSIITATGCYLAFFAGSNSLAKAVGPLVAADVFTPGSAAWLGGVGMGLGAVFIGPRLLETVGRGITSITPLKAVLIELVSGTILMLASMAGVPVSLAEIVTCSVIGFSCGSAGIRLTYGNQHVKVMSRLWPVCPVLTAAMALIACAALQIVPGVFVAAR